MEALLLLTLLAAGEATPLMRTGEQLMNSVFGLFYEPEYETAPYTVLSTGPGQVEEREYPLQNWVCTRKTAAPGREDDTTGMFWGLFNYIQGANQARLKIPMTTPVTTLVAPDGENVLLEMCFYIGSANQANPPAPTNPEVFIQRMGARILTRRLSGYMSASDWLAEARDLKTVLEAGGKAFDKTRYYKVGYDSPFKWWNRRNEVWYTEAQ